MSNFVKVATKKELSEGSSKLVEVGGKRIALFKVGDNFYAIDDVCTHKGGPLHEGTLYGEKVECPWHRGRFNLNSGEAVNPPARQPVVTYKVRTDDENIEIEVPE
jgi:NAD(P)H-dependent nitrite reductase small subunit